MHEFRVVFIAEHLFFTLLVRLQIIQNLQHQVFEKLLASTFISTPRGALVHVKFSPTSIGAVLPLLEH